MIDKPKMYKKWRSKLTSKKSGWSDIVKKSCFNFRHVYKILNTTMALSKEKHLSKFLKILTWLAEHLELTSWTFKHIDPASSLLKDSFERMFTSSLDLERCFMTGSNTQPQFLGLCWGLRRMWLLIHRLKHFIYYILLGEILLL